jgi:methylated-DNA-protein-cysteine methyltransferase-like protein
MFFVHLGRMARPPLKTHYFEAVYDVVRLIPRGRVTTYGAIADFLALGSARMAGWALRNLAPGDEVPAHRVVNRLGRLTGKHHFPDPEFMQRMLEAEGVRVEDDTVQDFGKLFWNPAEELL